MNFTKLSCMIQEARHEAYLICSSPTRTLHFWPKHVAHVTRGIFKILGQPMQIML